MMATAQADREDPQDILLVGNSSASAGVERIATGNFRVMKPLASHAITALALLLISACVGGGDSAESTMPTTPAPSGPTLDTAFSANPSLSAEANRQAATATPAFGSVTQSSNVNIAGVTTDAAQVTRQGSTFHLKVLHRDYTAFTLNTDDHLIESDAGVSPVTGRAWEDGVLVGYNSTALIVMRGAIDYSISDVNDWMAGGYWLNVEGNWRDGQVSGVEVGAFVDGPEISEPANIPVGGNASYSGIASGAYAAEYGTDTDGTAGTIEIGEYSGSFRAVANFSRGIVSGSVRNVYLDAVVTEPDGTSYPDYGSSPTRLEIGATAINSEGTFNGTDVRLADPRFSFSTNEGSWGGRFSIIDDYAGNPRVIAGTHGGAATTTGGTAIRFIGAHFGATPDF